MVEPLALVVELAAALYEGDQWALEVVEDDDIMC